MASQANLRSDVLVTGAGVIGLTTALKLAEQGASVVVCDHGLAGREASWAGAGMLPPGQLDYARTPEARLRSYSGTLWPDFSRQLHETTGIDNGFRVCGAVEFFEPGDSTAMHRQLEDWHREHLRVEILDAGAVARQTGCLNPHFTQACYLPDFAQVRNPRHVKALIQACRGAGVRVVEETGPLRLTRSTSRIARMTGTHHQFDFDAVCVAAGAWSSELLNQAGVSLPVKPVRGQIVLLQHRGDPIRSVIELGRRYIVPRQDGLVLAGSTEEDAGFEKRTTVEGVRQLMELAVRLCPALRSAELVRCWAGLRPASPDELPFLGRVDGFDNLWVATGHFRSGLQMSVGTGVILSRLITGQPSPIDLSGLTAGRMLCQGHSPGNPTS